MKDLKLDANWDIVPGRLGFETVADRDCVAQRIGTVLQGYFGEWFLDLNWGTPWYQKVLGINGVTDATAESVVRRAILGVEGVKSLNGPIRQISNRKSRSMGFFFSATTIYGVVGGVSTAP